MAMKRGLGEMAAMKFRSFSLARAMIASLLVTAAILQNLVSVGAHVMRADSSGWLSIGSAGFSEALCGADGKSDGGPAPERHDSGDCCLSCGGRDHWKAPQQETWSTLAAFRRSTAVIVRISRPVVGIIGSQIGWMSSWSSRAPPHFS